jgi:hypothetical protein
MQEPNQSLEEMVRNLPLEIRQEVRDFIEFLLEKRVRKPQAELSLEWRGALRDLRDQYTSQKFPDSGGQVQKAGRPKRSKNSSVKRTVTRSLVLTSSTKALKTLSIT